MRDRYHIQYHGVLLRSPARHCRRKHLSAKLEAPCWWVETSCLTYLPSFVQSERKNILGKLDVPPINLRIPASHQRQKNVVFRALISEWSILSGLTAFFVSGSLSCGARLNHERVFFSSSYPSSGSGDEESLLSLPSVFSTSFSFFGSFSMAWSEDTDEEPASPAFVSSLDFLKWGGHSEGGKAPKKFASTAVVRVLVKRAWGRCHRSAELAQMMVCISVRIPSRGVGVKPSFSKGREKPTARNGFSQLKRSLENGLQNKGPNTTKEDHKATHPASSCGTTFPWPKPGGAGGGLNGFHIVRDAGGRTRRVGCRVRPPSMRQRYLADSGPWQHLVLSAVPSRVSANHSSYISPFTKWRRNTCASSYFLPIQEFYVFELAWHRGRASTRVSSGSSASNPITGKKQYRSRFSRDAWWPRLVCQ